MCAFEDRAEQMAIGSAFLKVDLDRREQVVYAAADTADTIAVLPAAGVDVARERERGALQFLTMCNSHLRGWRCDADTMIES